MSTEATNTKQQDPVNIPSTHLSAMTPEEMAASLGLKSFQARQIFKWIHAKQVFDFSRMSDLSKELRQRLSTEYQVCNLSLVKSQASQGSGTKKVLLELPDGERVESVYIPARDRVTLCLSTQVGCAIKCTFCATGQSGYARNLDAGEIVEQALYLLAGEEMGGRSPNIVYMGMGEPFRNYDATIRSMHLLMDENGLGIGARRITVSTVGEIEGIEKFANEDWQVRLSISLHAANDRLRSELVPLNRKYNIRRLMKAVNSYLNQTGRQITFEWTLIRGVNDSTKDADELAQLVSGLKTIVNLIPYNPVAGIDYAPPGRRECEAFRSHLLTRGVKSTLRLERGQDINAACGQLRRQTSKQK